MKRFLPYAHLIKPICWQFYGGILAGVIYAVSSAAGIPAMIKSVFPAIFNEPGAASSTVVEFAENRWGENYQEPLLILCVSIMPITFLIRATAMYANKFLLDFSSLYILERLRNQVYHKILNLPLSFYDNNDSGKTLQKIMGDTELLKKALIMVSSDLIIQPVMVLSASGFLLYQCFTEKNVAFAMIALVSVPLCIIPIRLLGKRMKANHKKTAPELDLFQGEVIESLQSPKEIKSFNLEPLKESKFATTARKIFKLGVKNTKYSALISPSIEFIAMLGFTLALYIGAKNGMTNSTFMSMGLALYFAYEPVKKLGKIKANIKMAEVSLDRLEEILHLDDDVPESSNPISLSEKTKGSLSFDEVKFTYTDINQKKPVSALSKVNVTINPGDCVALVGPSGAGKTTFMNLIPRFYEVSEGTLKLDGVNIKDLSKSSLRSQIALVPQSPQLFSDSIANNIRMGNLESTDEQIIEAAKKAAAHEFIQKLPQGYHTKVGERGELLSGGQRQRISIARAFLKDAPILLLDEATSALDNESEAEIQKTLTELTQNRTTLMIAHRFSSLKNATRTLYFENGEIKGDGSHDELISNCQGYKKLYDMSKLES